MNNENLIELEKKLKVRLPLVKDESRGEFIQIAISQISRGINPDVAIRRALRLVKGQENGLHYNEQNTFFKQML